MADTPSSDDEIIASIGDALRAVPSYTNRTLGKLLLSTVMKVKARELGAEITPKFQQAFCNTLKVTEAGLTENAALEKALHKAAVGDFKAAGRIFRDFMDNGAIDIRLRMYAKIGIDTSRQKGQFGEAGIKAKKSIANETRIKVKHEKEKILASRRNPLSERELAGLISKRTGIPVDTVRRHLRHLSSPAPSTR